MMVFRWFKREKQIRKQRWIVQIVQLAIAVLGQNQYLLYNLTYAFKRPPTQILKLIVEPFWIAQIDGRDSLITNIIFSKATLGQIRSLEVIEHLKNLKKTDFFNL